MISAVGGTSSFDKVLAAAKRRDERALAELYRMFNAGLVRYLSLSAPAHAEDLAQEAWLGAASNLPKFDGDERQFRTWLFTIARRRLIDHWRASGREPTELTIRDVTRTSHDDPHAHLDSLAAISELVVGMSSIEREIVILRIVTDLSVDDVASIVGRTPSSVRVIQHRAIKKAAVRLARIDAAMDAATVTP